MFKAILVVATVLGSQAGLGQARSVRGLECSGSMKYSIDFNGMWSSARHPVEYPSDASFSPIVVASHTGNFQVWRTGELAGNGVQVVAETGNPEPLVRELYKAKRAGYVKDIAQAESPIDSTTSLELEIIVDRHRPYVSMVTMLFPSPDWFTGIRDVDLCDRRTGQWKKKIDLNSLMAYDAGTDSGRLFDSPNEATKPAEKIFLLTCGNGVFCNKGDKFLPVASVRLQQQKNCYGKKDYALNFNGMWSAARHPVRYPSDASFSPIVVAAHSKKFVLWATGEFASKGVQVVAETGNPNPLVGELVRAKKKGLVLDIARAEAPIDSTDSEMLYITVDNEHSLVSLVTMLFPSPDWFTGIRDVELCDRSTGRWRSEVELNSLMAYDAGTDSGEFFDSEDQPTKPAERIFLLTCGEGVFCQRGQKFLPVAAVEIEAKANELCNFKCPANSMRKPNRRCYNNFDDCACTSGYVKSSGRCVRVGDSCNYKCPRNSVRKPNRRCYNNFDDCECSEGYMRSSGRCVRARENCNYKCPSNSMRKPNRRCYNNFDDCQCESGFVRSSGRCMRSNESCNYKCPSNSFRKPNRRCYNNFDDCECRPRYYKSNGRCVRK